MDDSLGCSLWFASRGLGKCNGKSYQTPARVNNLKYLKKIHFFFIYLNIGNKFNVSGVIERVEMYVSVHGVYGSISEGSRLDFLCQWH